MALRGVVDEMFAGADSLTPCDARQLADALMHNALAGASDVGAAAALSGPVLRGDRSTVEAHLAALAASAPAARPVYRALMLAALELARARGLSASAAEALQALLEDPSEP